jgi:hypothetical protein
MYQQQAMLSGVGSAEAAVLLLLFVADAEPETAAAPAK